MPQGIEIYNDDNTIQIGSAYSTFYLVASGSQVVSGTGLLSLNVGTSFDAFATSMDHNGSSSGSVSPGVFLDSPTSNLIAAYETGGTAKTIRWYCYRSTKHRAPSSSLAGLEIYNADGTVAWTSAVTGYLKSRPKVPVVLSTGSSNVGATGYAFMQYGHIVGAGFEANPPDPDPIYRTRGLGIWLNGTTVHWRMQRAALAVIQYVWAGTDTYQFINGGIIPIRV